MRIIYEIAVVAVAAIGIPWVLLGMMFAIENRFRYGKSK